MEVKMSDIMFIVANAAVQTGEKMGEKIQITNLYKKDLVAIELAHAAKHIRLALEIETGCKIELIKDEM